MKAHRSSRLHYRVISSRLSIFSLIFTAMQTGKFSDHIKNQSFMCVIDNFLKVWRVLRNGIEIHGDNPQWLKVRRLLCKYVKVRGSWANILFFFLLTKRNLLVIIGVSEEGEEARGPHHAEKIMVGFIEWNWWTRSCLPDFHHGGASHDCIVSSSSFARDIVSILSFWDVLVGVLQRGFDLVSPLSILRMCRVSSTW